MRNGLAYKFAHHPDLRQKLITTKGKTLIEGNFWHDNTWGDCYCENCKDTKGKNLLGRSLMALRDLF
jgi:predicted NAD-dependent protein-ADP-ribosyltransferase YbiA (DUF1768 family)